MRFKWQSTLGPTDRHTNVRLCLRSGNKKMLIGREKFSAEIAKKNVLLKCGCADYKT